MRCWLACTAHDTVLSDIDELTKPHENSAQFYVGCAQIKIVGNGTGVLAPAVEIPGLYNDTTPGVLIPDFWTKITNYTEPGPELWPEGTQTQHVVKQLGDK